MKVVIFCHSLVSDWNHGNAHFLRGVTRELMERGHAVAVYEPRGGWSRASLAAGEGPGAERDFAQRFPELSSTEYDLAQLDLDAVLDHADLVLVHEWNEPELVARIGHHRARVGGYTLLFHDTHHRAATAPAEMARFDLSAYDGVLAFGEVITQIYRDRQWVARAWTWHEAADTRVFAPQPVPDLRQDLVWVGNWGDDERSRELREFLLGPARRLRLSGSVHGVRYPWRARLAIRHSGLRYRGWVANAPGTGDLRPSSLDRPCAAPPLRRGAAGNSDDPGIRGARLRHPADLLAVGGCRRPIRPRRGLPDGKQRIRDDDCHLLAAQRPGASRDGCPAWSGDDPGAAYLCAPRR